MNYKRVFIISAAIGLLASVSQAELIYQTTFGASSYTYGTSLNGQDGWSGSNAGIVTASGVVFNGATTPSNNFDTLPLNLNSASPQTDLLQVTVTALVTSPSINDWDVIGLTSPNGFAGRAFGMADNAYPGTNAEYTAPFPSFLTSNYPYFIQVGSWQTYEIEADLSNGNIYGYLNGVLVGYSDIGTNPGLTGIEFGMLNQMDSLSPDSLVIGSVSVSESPEPGTIQLALLAITFLLSASFLRAKRARA